MANTGAQDSRLIQAIRKQAIQWLADDARDKKLLRERDDKSIPYGVPTPQWYRSKIKEFTLPSRADLIGQGAIHSRSQGPFHGEMNMFFYDAKTKNTSKNYFNIGSKILLATSNIHNSALIAQFSELSVHICTKFRGASF